MKKSEFKKIIKPIVGECIRESLMEDGLISGIIAEVVKGISVATPVTPPAPPALREDPVTTRMRNNAFSSKQIDKLAEHRTKLMGAIGADAYNGMDLFEGTSPVPAEMTPAQQASPLASQAPADAGVDINNLFGSVGTHWKAHMTEIKERE